MCLQGSQIEVTEDREAILDCVSPGGKPAPDVRLFVFVCLCICVFVYLCVCVFVYLCTFAGLRLI